MCPPATATHERHLLGIERIRRCIRTCGMFLHSACSATSSCRRVCGCGWRCLIALPSWSHKCSIGLKSGENVDHGSVAMFCCCKKSIVARAEWGRTLSCWNTVPSRWAARNGTTVGRRTSLMYRWDVSVPSMIIRGVRCREKMPPHTITLPPPHLSASCKQQFA